MLFNFVSSVALFVKGVLYYQLHRRPSSNSLRGSYRVNSKTSSPCGKSVYTILARQLDDSVVFGVYGMT